MNEARVLGNNVRVLLGDNGIEQSTFANKLGYSEEEVQRLLEGRLYAAEEDMEDIAAFFGVSVSYLHTRLDAARYQNAGCIHCNNDFKNEGNQELILDIIDMYCDVKEAMARI